MGSPYIVSTLSNISTIRSLRGYRRVVEMIKRSMDCTCSPSVNSDGSWEISSPEDVVIMQLSQEMYKALLKRDRRIITLQARYEWTGWERFQRGVVIDFTHPIRGDERSLVITTRSTSPKALLDALTGGEGHLWESAPWL